MYIYGTKANLLWTISHHQNLDTRLSLFEKGKEVRDIPLTPIDPYVEEIEEFSSCIQTGSGQKRMEKKH